MHWAAFIATSVATLGLGYGSVRAARAAAGPWRLPPFAMTALALGLFTSGWLVPVCLVARWAGNFDAGLIAAAVVGVIFAVVSRRWMPTESPVPPADRGTKIALAAVLVGLVAVYGYVAFQYQMHDEHAVFGHKSMVEQFRRDVYPLYYPSKPSEEARYHYGFDVLAGAAARAYGLDSDDAIDLVCLWMVIFMAFAAAGVAADAGATKSAPLAALAIHFGGGLAWVMLAGVEGRHPRCLAQYHHPSCDVELFPSQFLNVFQHPVSVGVPMLLVLVLVLPRLITIVSDPSEGVPSSRRTWPTLAVAGVVLLAATAVGQFVYYALGALAALAAAPVILWDRGRRAWWGALGLVVVVAASFGLAYLLGGMLAHNPSIDPDLVVRRPEIGFPEGEAWTGILYHHVVNLGLGFMLIPVFAAAAIWKRRPAVVMLLAFGIGGILVAQLYVYLRSWDIVKFPSAASFALSLTYVLVVDRALVGSRFPMTWVRRAGAALLLGTGLVSAIFVVWPLQGSLRLYEPQRWRGDALVRQTIEWWHANGYRSEDVIYAQPNVAKELSLFGGLSVVAQDTDLYYMGVKQRELGRQRSLSRQLRASMDARALAQLEVRWLMFSGEELTNLGAAARKAMEDPKRFEVVATFDGGSAAKTRRIWLVLGDR